MKKLILILTLVLVAVIGYFLFFVKTEEVSTLKVSELAKTQNTRFDLDYYQVVPPTDLPPEGTRSLFDHIIAQNGSLPYPFESLVDLLAGYDKQGKVPVSVMIPDGRSLLKGHADFRHPRIIVAADARPVMGAELDVHFKGRLFLGFVEKASEIEVISYNQAAGRYEFQLVKDYRKGGIPQITYARRAVCTTCHVGEAPIFPVRPWDETSGQPAISKKIRAARRGDRSVYQGLPIDNNLLAPETIDEMTDAANLIPVTQKIWIDGCGDGNRGRQCRSLMLSQALRFLWNPGDYDIESSDHQELIALQSVEWPDKGIVVHDNDLLNRNPLTEQAPRRYLFQWLDDLLTRDGTQGKDSKLDRFEKLPPLRAELDPLTPRPPRRVLGPQAPDGVYGIAQMFTDQDRRRLEQASDYQLEIVLLSVQAAQVQQHLDRAPFRRVAVMQALLISLGDEDKPGYCCNDTSAMSAPSVAGLQPLDIEDGTVLKHYETYCFACHRGNPRADLDFMNGETPEAVLANIRTIPEIREVLDYERYLGTSKAGKLMPPRDSWQRREMDQARESGNDPAQEMAAIVPGLFGF